MALSMTSFILVQCCVTKPSRVVVRWWWWRWWWWWWDDADDCPDFGVVSLEMTFTAPSIHPIIHPCIHASFHPSIHPSNSHVLDAYVNASCTMHRFQHYYQTLQANRYKKEVRMNDRSRDVCTRIWCIYKYIYIYIYVCVCIKLK